MIKYIVSKSALFATLALSLAAPLTSIAAWTEVTIPGEVARPQDITYFNGKFVAVGYQAEIITSTDGITWTLQEVPAEAGNPDYPDSLPGFRAVAASDSLIIAVGDQGVIATSTNGTDWTVAQQADSSQDFYSDIAYGDGTFVIVGGVGVTSTTNGVDFTQSSVANEYSFRTVVFLGEQFLVMTYTGTLAYVGNGASWDALTTNLNGYFFIGALASVNDAIYAGGNISAGQSIGFATSEAGFSDSTLSAGAILGYTNGFAGNGSVVAAVGGNFYDPTFGSVLVSSDNGVSFGLDTDELSHAANAIVYANGLWVIAGEGYVAYTDSLSGGGDSTPYLVQGADDLGDGWYENWIGTINVNSWPWVYTSIGWFYAGNAGNTNASGWYFMTAPQLNCWVYMGDGTLPWLYCQPTGKSEGWWYVDGEQNDGFTYFFMGSEVIAIQDEF